MTPKAPKTRSQKAAAANTAVNPTLASPHKPLRTTARCKRDTNLTAEQRHNVLCKSPVVWEFTHNKVRCAGCGTVHSLGIRNGGLDYSNFKRHIRNKHGGVRQGPRHELHFVDFEFKAIQKTGELMEPGADDEIYLGAGASLVSDHWTGLLLRAAHAVETNPLHLLSSVALAETTFAA